MRRYRHALAVLFAAAPQAMAQSPRAITVRADNDAFDFWKAPASRPDEDYTSGVRIAVSGGDIPTWGRALGNGVAPCASDVTPCRSQTWELGQDIYSAARGVNGEPVHAGLRPNAGWLYVTQTARVLRPARSDEVALTVGVTGPPSLARYTQNFFHGLAPDFNRPTDWRDQVKFQPGINVQYVLSRREVVREAGALGIDILPRVRLAAGNVLTAAEAGMRVRTGFHLSHPWLPALRSAPTEIALAVGASARGVARDIFLDGTTAENGRNVGHEPFVYAWDATISVRRGWFDVSYGAVTDSRAYAGGPSSHTWASLVAGVSLTR
jgi:hypothetical protein